MKDFLTNKIINIQGINNSELSVDNEGHTFIHIACILDNGDELKEFIKKRAQYIDRRDNMGKTPIIYACENSSIDCIQILIDNGVDKNQHYFHTIDVSTPLCISMLNDTTDCFELLIKNGANVNQILLNDTILIRAIKINKFDYVKLLIKYGANVNIGNSKPPLIEACNHSSNQNNIEIIKFLIESGADINYVDIDSNTPLTISTNLLKYDIVRLLILSGADINLNTPFNLLINRIFMYYIDEDQNLDTFKYDLMMSLIRLFIKNGANINTPNINGEKPLLIATRTRDIKLINLLVENGAT
jgi:ankyrin repeat protein